MSFVQNLNKNIYWNLGAQGKEKEIRNEWKTIK